MKFLTTALSATLVMLSTLTAGAAAPANAPAPAAPAAPTPLVIEPAAIDDALDAHRVFLERQFAAGIFIAAGPKVPRDGGIILASAIDRDRLDAILAEDPFAQQNLAHYDVIEFKATRLAPGLNLPMPSEA